MCLLSTEKHPRLNHILTGFLLIAVSILLPAALILGCGIHSFHDLFAARYEEEIVVSSPDAKYTLIIRPWSGWDSTGAEFYCRAGSGTPETKIGSIAAAGHNHPFRDDRYRVIWNHAAVTILYWNHSEEKGISDLSQWESVTYAVEAYDPGRLSQESTTVYQIVTFNQTEIRDKISEQYAFVAGKG